MSEKYLDINGLTYFWNRIVAKFAPLISPALTGTPTAPTAAAGTNSGQIATTAFVKTAVDSMAYTLPTASASTLGGVKVGTNLNIDGNGILSATDTTYDDFDGATRSSHGTQGLVPEPDQIDVVGSDDMLRVLCSDGEWHPLFLRISSSGTSGFEIGLHTAERSGSSWVYTPHEIVSPSATKTFANATSSAAGMMSSTDKSKLDSITMSGGKISNTVLPAATSSAAGTMSSTDKAKLDSIAMSGGKIDPSILPSYVDDVIEAYPRSGQTELSASWLSATAGGSALTPEAGKIYILMADSTTLTTNTQLRWSGSTYVKLNDGGIVAITNAEIDTITAL